MRRARIFALVLAIVLLLCITAAGAFIACEAGHDCCGDDCPICEAITICTGTLRLLGIAAAVSLALCFIVRNAARRSVFPPDLFSQKTPVALKVLLLN